MLKVFEDEGKGLVMVGAHEVDGFIDDQPCPNCSEPRVYSYDYDAFLCPQCNVWLDPACSDSTCGYCRARPTRPLPH